MKTTVSKKRKRKALVYHQFVRFRLVQNSSFSLKIKGLGSSYIIWFQYCSYVFNNFLIGLWQFYEASLCAVRPKVTQVNLKKCHLFLNIPVWSKKPRFFLALNRLLFFFMRAQKRKNRVDGYICGILRTVGVARVFASIVKKSDRSCIIGSRKRVLFELIFGSKCSSIPHYSIQRSV